MGIEPWQIHFQLFVFAIKFLLDVWHRFPRSASFYSLRETHEIAKAQQEKNSKLREAFGISEYFVEGTSFNPERKAREDLAKSEAMQKEIQAEKESKGKRYALVRTPTPEKSDSNAGNDDDRDDKVEKKSKKKKRTRDG